MPLEVVSGPSDSVSNMWHDHDDIDVCHACVCVHKKAGLLIADFEVQNGICSG